MPALYTSIIGKAFEELETKQRQLGRDVAHPEIAQCYENIGKAHFECREFYDALKYHKAALGNRLNHYKASACRVPNVAHSYNNIGRTYVALEKRHKAVDAFSNAAHILRAAYGDDAYHVDIARTYNLLGSVLREMCKYQDSMDYHAQAQAMYFAVHGLKESHDDTAFTYKLLGDLLRDQAQFAGAEKEYKKSLGMYRYVFAEYFLAAPRKTPIQNYASVYIGRGEVYKMQGKLAMAAESFRDAFNLLRSYYGHVELNDDIIYGELLDMEGQVQLLAQDHRQAASDFESGHGAKYDFYNNEEMHAPVGDSYVNIGNLHVARFEYDLAIDLYQKAYAIFEKVHQGETDGNHPTIARCENLIGHSLLQKAEFEKAIVHHQNALFLFKDYYGQTYSCPDIANAYKHLAEAYRAYGEYDAAHENNFESLKMNKVLYSGNLYHPNIARNYYDIANVFFSQAEYHQAFVYYSKAMTLTLFAFGDHGYQFIVTLRNSIGLVFMRQGKYDDALSSHVHAVAMAKDLYTVYEHHPEIAVSLKYVGNVFAKHGVYDKAMTYYLEADRQFDSYHRWQEMESRHPAKALLLVEMGGVSYQKENFARALEKFNSADYILRCIYGMNDHPLKAIVNKHIGDTYNEKDEEISSLQYYMESLRIRQKCYGKDRTHPETAESHYFVGTMSGDLGKYSLSLEHHTKALGMRQTIYAGTKHRDLIASFDGVGLAYQRQRKYDLALEYFEKALETKKIVFDAPARDVNSELADSYTLLGNYYDATRQYPESYEFHSKAKDIQSNLDNREEISSCFDDIGVTMTHSLRWEEAIEAHRSSLKLKQELFDEHIQTASQSPKRNQSMDMKDDNAAFNAIKIMHYSTLASSHFFLGNAYYANAGSILNSSADVSERYDTYLQSLSNYAEALEMWQVVYGEGSNSDIADVLTCIGQILQTDELQDNADSEHRDDYKAAIEHHERALAIRHELYDADGGHPEIASSLANLGKCFTGNGDFVRAEIFLNKALNHYEAVSEVYEYSHQDVADVYEKLGTVSYKKQDYNEALEMYLKAFSELERMYGEFELYCTPLAFIYKNLANTYQQLGKQKDSRRCQAMARKVANLPADTEPRSCLVM